MNVVVGSHSIFVYLKFSSIPQGDLESVAQLAWRSAGYYVKAGQPDSAAQLLSRKAFQKKELLSLSSGFKSRLTFHSYSEMNLH